MHWPVTLQNSLDASLGVGYSAYLQQSDLNQFFITPGSGLSFDIYVGDVKINLHERIGITENAYENSGAGTQNRNLVSLNNAVGTSLMWDMNQSTMVSLGYDHANNVTLERAQGLPDSASDNIFVNTGVRVRPELMLGVEAGGSKITYNQSSSASASEPNALQWSTGVFGSAKISDYLDVRLDAGYTTFTPDSTTTSLVASDSSGFYFSASLSHRVNRFLNYTLTAGRSTDLSAYGQAQTAYYVQFSPGWNLFEKYTLSTPFAWRQASSVYGSTAGGNGSYDQFTMGLNVGRQLTKKLSAAIAYQFVKETSGQAELNYTENIVNLNLSYQF
jgi:hypothetical protein